MQKILFFDSNVKLMEDGGSLLLEEHSEIRHIPGISG